jgi:hypothetical protein
MTESRGESSDVLAGFMAALAEDQLADRVPPVEVYLERFPGIEEQIFTEYLAVVSTRPSSPGPSKQDRPKSIRSKGESPPSVLPHPKSRVPLIVVAVVTLAIGALAYWMHSRWERSVELQARSAAVRSALLGLGLPGRTAGAPTPEALRVLQSVVSDPATLDLMVADPRASTGWDKILGPTLPHDQESGAIRLFSPRGVVAAGHRGFEFELLPPGSGNQTVWVWVQDSNGQRYEWTVDLGPAHQRHMTLLPNPAGLTVGRWEWGIRAPEGIRRSGVEPTATMEVVSAETVTRTLNAVGHTGHPDIDALLRAAQLATHGFAVQSLLELLSIRSSDDPAIRSLAAVTRARCLSILGDQPSAEALKESLRK